MSRHITVIGTGYVGLVAAIGMADLGNYVIGTDLNTYKINKLKKGISTIYEPGLEEYLRRNIKNQKLQFTGDLEYAIKNSEVIFIAVGTPSQENGEVDLSQLKSVVNTICENINNYKVIVTKSTVPIGTNKWIKQTIKENIGNNIEFDIVSNPEFLREGRAMYDFFHPDRVVIGCENERSKEILKDLYRPLYITETPFVWCNIETAELIKYSSNAFLATKISFINQMANLAEEVGADINVISKAMGMDGRIGKKFLHPGPGYGGSCFPKDTRAVVKIGENYNVEMSLIREVINANTKQKEKMVFKLQKYFKNLSQKTIAILGAAFKNETDDIRESASLDIIKLLLEKGAFVKVHDPKALDNLKKIFGNSIQYCNEQLDAIKDADAIMILTEWNEYRNIDLAKFKMYMKGKIIIDTRNILNIDEVKRLGFIYEGVGRK